MDKIMLGVGSLYPYDQKDSPTRPARSDGNGKQEPVKTEGTAQTGHTLRSPA